MTTAALRVDLQVAPVDAALHRVLAACHRRNVTIDRLQYTRSSTMNRIVMDVIFAPTRIAFLTNVFEREPLVLRCTTSPVDQ